MPFGQGYLGGIFFLQSKIHCHLYDVLFCQNCGTRKNFSSYPLFSSKIIMPNEILAGKCFKIYHIFGIWKPIHIFFSFCDTLYTPILMYTTGEMKNSKIKQVYFTRSFHQGYNILFLKSVNSPFL